MAGEATVVAVYSLAAGALACAGSAALARLGCRLIMDDERGAQKIHRAPVPRVGGLAVAAGVVVALGAAQLFGDAHELSWLLLACAVPGFVWGLIEDLYKRGLPLVRLVLTGTSAMLAYVVLDARITEVAVPGLDGLLAVHVLSFAFTVLAMTGIAHAMNVIDGLNGLAGGTATLAAAGIAAVAFAVDDPLVFPLACIVAASLAGFLVVNFPRGYVFLGDGGAYLAGLLLAELSVLLVQRNSEVSPWFPLLLLAYPVWETLFSVYRRRSRGGAATQADALHLHSLVYRRVVRGESAGERNWRASLLMLALPAACCVAAVSAWHDSGALQLAMLGFAGFYGAFYRRIVRFRVRAGWLTRRAPAAQALPR